MMFAIILCVTGIAIASGLIAGVVNYLLVRKAVEIKMQEIEQERKTNAR